MGGEKKNGEEGEGEHLLSLTRFLTTQSASCINRLASSMIILVPPRKKIVTALEFLHSSITWRRRGEEEEEERGKMEGGERGGGERLEVRKRWEGLRFTSILSLVVPKLISLTSPALPSLSAESSWNMGTGNN